MALDHLNRGGDNLAVNIGTGKGTSIRDILSTIGRVTGRQVPIEMYPRRPGDPPSLFADTTLARQIFGFVPHYSDLDTIVRTASRFFRPSEQAA